MHSANYGSLLAGLLLAAFGVAGLVELGGHATLPWLWLLPALLVGLGIAGIIGAATRQTK